MSPQQFISQLGHPRVILLMVTAGKAVDTVIAQLLPLLDADDILIDGGNSQLPGQQPALARAGRQGHSLRRHGRFRWRRRGALRPVADAGGCRCRLADHP
jgi:hypothetical protein